MLATKSNLNRKVIVTSRDRTRRGEVIAETQYAVRIRTANGEERLFSKITGFARGDGKGVGLYVTKFHYV